MERLTPEEIEFLKKIRKDYKEIDIVELIEYLTDYFQEHGIEDIDENPEQLMLEKIIDKLSEE